MEDPEMLGEFLDCLKSFGLKNSHPLIRTGMDYLLSQQNADGSWGDVEAAEDIYLVYHSTWTAIDGLRDYAWRGEGLSFPKLKPLLEQWAKTKG
jgi:squalene cyclase